MTALRSVALAVCLLGMALAGCKRQEPSPDAPDSSASASDGAGTAPAVTAPPSTEAGPRPPAAATGAALDSAALRERDDPARLLRFYAAALEQGRWALAARAWRASSGVTADTLKAAYDRGQPPRIVFGKGSLEGAAGSSYYEVPVTLRFPGQPPEQGTLTLRRVNDVPGATEEQLNWRIERSTIGATQ